MPINTILFDLDGTLIEPELEFFLFGWLRFQQLPATLYRITGALLMTAGLLFISYG